MPADLLYRGPVPEHLPGEPARRGQPPWVVALLLPLRAAFTAALLVASLPAWLLFGLTVLRWGRPPTTVRATQVLRYLRLIWTVAPPDPGLPITTRGWLTLVVLQHVALTPWWGLCWQVDEALYDLDAVDVRAPLFEISAGRSGSTQLARHLEDDPALAAPNLLQALFPYLWLWRLLPRTLGPVISEATVRRRVEGLFPPELRDRHELDPFRSDTADGLLYTSHLFYLAPSLGPEVALEDFAFWSTAPHNAAAWEEDFPALVDRLARKTLLTRPGRRFFLKGHFLRGAEPLARRFPDGVFLSVVRDPLPRLQSAVNYMRANPHDPILGPVPWAWWAEAIVSSEVAYGEAEQAWFTADPGQTIRCVVPFRRFVDDLPGTMAQIYRECFGVDTLPPHVPREHPPRVRHSYLLNRALPQVGIDPDALAVRVAPFRAWLEALEAEA
jgi:hypothetical protein